MNATLILAANGRLVFIAAGLVMLVLLLVAFLVFLSVFRPWLQCFLSGAPISFFEILGMRLRRTNPANVIPYGIMAAQAGHPIRWSILESTHLQGLDLEKLVTAWLAVKGREMDLTFEDLVNADRDSRLSELLGE